jgi:hypothetical protein
MPTMLSKEVADFAQAALMGDCTQREIDFFSTVRNTAEEILYQRRLEKDPLNASRPNTLRRPPPPLPLHIQRKA